MQYAKPDPIVCPVLDVEYLRDLVRQVSVAAENAPADEDG